MDDFFERIGVENPYKVVQFQSMSESLKNKLWNIFNNMHYNQIYIRNFKKFICIEILGQRFDKLTEYKIEDLFEEFFYERWFRPFYIFEIYFEVDYKSNPNYLKNEVNQGTEKHLNKYLVQENSAYRFNLKLRKFIPITNEYEIKEIENSLENTKNLTKLQGCNIHLTQSIKLFSDRENADYRNSIKESISAIESLMIILDKNEKKNFKSGIDSLNESLNIHKSLIEGFKKFYGYTSDEGGIRHSFLNDVKNIDLDDAKFMLVSCSAFINYIIAKCEKAGIELK